MFKQNSLITRYCLAVVVMLALLGPLAQKGRGDFELWDDLQLTVKWSHSQGILHERSGAFIVPGSSASDLRAFDSSTVGIYGGGVGHLDAYDSSTVNISSGGSVSDRNLIAWDSSIVNISSGGSVSHSLTATGFSTVNISGGSIGDLYASGSSVVDISGGSVSTLEASGYSVVTFYGQNFSVGDGLLLFGGRVVGKGNLSGEWFDGTQWVMNISANIFTAMVMAISEPANKPYPFCAKPSRMDFNGDCKVDFFDFAIMASSWLECNLVPESACWE